MCDDATDGTECDEYSITIYHPRGKEAGNGTTAALVLKLALRNFRIEFLSMASEGLEKLKTTS